MKNFVNKVKNKICSLRIKLGAEWKLISLSYFHNKSSLIFLIGTPSHNNVGDLAIAQSELLFLQTCGFKKKDIVSFDTDELNHSFIKIVSIITKCSSALCCLHGGGNMGNQWENEEMIRRKVLKSIQNDVLIFPQTFFYSNNEEGKKDKENSVVYYNNPRIHIIARDEVSYNEMTQVYPRADILLTPDIVLSNVLSSKIYKSNRRSGALFCLRNDIEKSLSSEDLGKLFELLRGDNIDFDVTDMIAPDYYVYNRERIIYNKLYEFSNYKVVITDRLHAMAFCALTGTPCIVFGNYNHKVAGTYKWLSFLDYIHFITLIEDAKSLIRSYLDSNTVYSYSDLLSDDFLPIKKIINNHYKNN